LKHLLTLYHTASQFDDQLSTQVLMATTVTLTMTPTMAMMTMTIVAVMMTMTVAATITAMLVVTMGALFF